MLERIDKFKLLKKVIRISNSTVDIDRRLHNLLQLFLQEMNLDLAWFFHLEREAMRLILQKTNEESPPPHLVLNLNDNFIGRAVLTRQTVLAGLEAVANLPENGQELLGGLNTLIACPVMDDQVIYGALTLGFAADLDLHEEWIDLTETITREIAGTIRNSRLYTESKKRISDLSVLYEVGRAVSSTLELDKVLDTVVNITCNVFLAEGTALHVVDTSTNTLRVSTEYGAMPKDCSFKHLLGRPVVRPPQELLYCVNREKAYIGPTGGDNRCPVLEKSTGVRSIICLPLPFKGAFKGTLSVYNKVNAPPGRSKEFDRADLELLTTMGTMISSSLENALVFQTVDGLARHNEMLVRNLSCLYEISGAMMTTVKTGQLLSIITRALTLQQGLNFDRSLVLLMNEDEDRLMGAALNEVRPEDRRKELLPLADLLKQTAQPKELSNQEKEFLNLKLSLIEDDGILVRTALEKKAFLLSPEEGETLSDSTLPLEFGRLALAAVPMLTKGKVVGVIAVDRDLSRQPISDEDMRNLSMLANQAGLAIENSRLYEYIENANLVLSQTKERLLEAEKLAALGEMAAGMAHEIRNPLVSIGGFTRRLLKNLAEDSPHRVYIEVIINEVTRLEKTLSEVLDFSRDTLGHLDEYNLNDVVSEALYILRRDFKEGRIEVVKDLGDIPMVLVDERQVKHVFFSIFFNATQAMDQGGVLTVRTYPTQVDDRSFAACEISDTGAGIPPEILSNIFNPFFTTKDTGTGLGLSIVHKIINRHHGQIDVVNRDEGGASFIIKLPVATEAGLYHK